VRRNGSAATATVAATDAVAAAAVAASAVAAVAAAHARTHVGAVSRDGGGGGLELARGCWRDDAWPGVERDARRTRAEVSLRGRRACPRDFYGLLLPGESPRVLWPRPGILRILTLSRANARAPTNRPPFYGVRPFIGIGGASIPPSIDSLHPALLREVFVNCRASVLTSSVPFLCKAIILLESILKSFFRVILTHAHTR
jgi:hypothetical protein